MREANYHDTYYTAERPEPAIVLYDWNDEPIYQGESYWIIDDDIVRDSREEIMEYYKAHKKRVIELLEDNDEWIIEFLTYNEQTVIAE